MPCSGTQNEPNPSSSALLANTAGSTDWSVTNANTPIFMAASLFLASCLASASLVLSLLLWHIEILRRFASQYEIHRNDMLELPAQVLLAACPPVHSSSLAEAAGSYSCGKRQRPTRILASSRWGRIRTVHSEFRARSHSGLPRILASLSSYMARYFGSPSTAT